MPPRPHHARPLHSGGRSVAVLSAALLLAAGGFRAPANAQSASVESRIDQPTAATLPFGVSTVKGTGRDSGDRSAPSGRMRTSVDMVQDGAGEGSRTATDPMKHLPSSMK